MKISIDYDGTLWAHMEFFRAFMKAMQKDGHQVGMLTGHNEDIRERDIELMLARGFPRPDFWFGRPPDFQGSNGSIFKAHIILSEKIDRHFDDCDYDNAESIALFKQCLGDQEFRLIHVKHRGQGVHSE